MNLTTTDFKEIRQAEHKYMNIYIPYIHTHTYIQKIYLGTLASRTQGYFHEGREFRKNILYRQTFKIQEQIEKNYCIGNRTR